MVGSQFFLGVHQEKKHHMLNEMWTLCEAPKVRALVEVYGAFYSPDGGKISIIALGCMDGGSLAGTLAGIVCTKKFMAKQILSVITAQGLSTLL